MLLCGGVKKELFGFDPRSTNNWIRGHAGHEDNTRCDWLAQNAATAQRSSGRITGRTVADIGI